MLFIRVLPRAQKCDGFAYSIVSLFYSIVLYNSLIYVNLYCRFSSLTENLIPLSFVQDNSKSNKANLIKFSGLSLETFVSVWYLNNCMYFV